MCFPIREGRLRHCPPSSSGYAKDMVGGRGAISSPFLPSLNSVLLAGFVEPISAWELTRNRVWGNTVRLGNLSVEACCS